MTDPMITDLRRELAKARDALIAAQTHLAAHAEMNAALHCATNVMHSPLHAKVSAAIQGIEHALQRTQPAVSVVAPDPIPKHTDTGCPWIAILADLDRCEHGRHEGDDRGDFCETTSRGNPHLRPGQVIGYGLRGDPIVMPTRENKHDPAAWRTPPTDADTPKEPTP